MVVVVRVGKGKGKVCFGLKGLVVNHLSINKRKRKRNLLVGLSFHASKLICILYQDAYETI